MGKVREAQEQQQRTQQAGGAQPTSGGAWQDSLQLGGPPGPGMAAPRRESRVEALLSPLFDAERVFDVCHVGLVLRAVLGVQLLVALGAALFSHDGSQWMQALSSATVVSLTGVLSWLLLLCSLRRPLARLGEVLQQAFVLTLGGLCALGGWLLLDVFSVDPGHWFQRLSVFLSGAAVAGLLLYWLRLRERLQRPADALARLVELQSRIRPHFLFNTLNTAMALVRIDPARAESVLEDLSELFRAALAETDTVVRLDAEIELARRYLAIEQLRFGARLRLHWQLDPQADAARVPPLLLQPLVENAVRHGVEPNDTGGDVEVITRSRGTEVEIVVINTVGAPARSGGHGLALRNVRQRLRLMHDVALRFEINPEPGRFSVRIVLPR